MGSGLGGVMGGGCRSLEENTACEVEGMEGFGEGHGKFGSCVGCLIFEVVLWFVGFFGFWLL